jgi:Legionella pneumophila major outer membrane protein precursor
MRSLIFSGLLLCSGMASALVGDCCGDYSAGVDLLYWKASHCPIAYARGFDFGEVDLVNDYMIDSDYDWGFRVWLEREMSCTTFGLSYLHLETTDNGRANRGGSGTLQLQGAEGDVDFANSSLKFRYQNIDLSLRQPLHEGCDYTVSAVGILRWVDIDMKNRTAGLLSIEIDIPRSLDQSTSFDGVGLGIGLSGEYCLPCWLDVGGHVTFAANLGKRKMGKLTAINRCSGGPCAPLFSSGHQATVFVPQGEFDLHLSHSISRCGALWTLTLGYELHYFWDALEYAATNESADGVPVSSCENVGFGGLYLGLSANF